MSPASSDHPVLLCYDGSDTAATAIAVAAQLLRGREAVVCHAWAGLSRAIFRSDPGDLPGALIAAAEELDAFDREAAERLTAAGVRLASAAGFRAAPLAIRERRKTWRTLLEAADQQDASAVVPARTGSRAWAARARQRLDRRAEPFRTTGAGGPRRRPEERWRAAPALLRRVRVRRPRNPRRRDAVLARSAIVVNLWESWVTAAPVLAGVARPVNAMTEDLDEIATGLSESTTADGVRLAAEAGFDAQPASACSGGSLWRSLLDVADQHDAEALVLGTRGLTGLSRGLGSVSNGVVHHSQRPVLVVPEPPAS